MDSLFGDSSLSSYPKSISWWYLDIERKTFPAYFRPFLKFVFVFQFNVDFVRRCSKQTLSSISYLKSVFLLPIFAFRFVCVSKYFLKYYFLYFYYPKLSSTSSTTKNFNLHEWHSLSSSKPILSNPKRFTFVRFTMKKTVSTTSSFSPWCHSVCCFMKLQLTCTQSGVVCTYLSNHRLHIENWYSDT